MKSWLAILSMGAALRGSDYNALGSATVFSNFALFMQAATRDIFLTVDRRNVGWISVEIGSADPKFLPVRVDPLPQVFG
jgi:hypothetical protein